MLAKTLLAVVNGVKTFVISANTTDLNLFTLAGSPTKKGRYSFQILAGVIVGQVAAAQAIDVGQFPTGSIITIVNRGSIYGRGGVGGVYSSSTGATAGSTGGDCIKTSYLNQTVRLINYGDIKAGGGGAGSGGYGAAGGNGGRGNITSTTGYEQPRSDVEWYIFDAVPNDNHVSWFGGGGSDSNGPNETLMLAALGLFEKGDYYSHTQDANPHNSWYVRLNYLQPAGTGGASVAGGSGGNGAGYNQARTDGVAGQAANAGVAGTNGAGDGGAGGAGGTGGNGGDWATTATLGTNGGNSTAGTSGSAGGVGEAGGASVSGGAYASAGVAGRAIIQGSSILTVTNYGIVAGATV